MPINEPPPNGEALGGALRQWLEELEQALANEEPGPVWTREAPLAAFGQRQDYELPLIDGRSVAAGVYDAGGRLLAATAAFRQGRCDRLVDRETLRAVANAGATAHRLIADSQSPAAATSIIAYGPAQVTASWRIPGEIHEAAQGAPRSVVVLTTTLQDIGEPLRDACFAYRLSGLQSRVALETIRTGSVKTASQSLGISYETAREALADAKKRLGVTRLPALVTRLTTLAFGVFPGSSDSAAVLTDVWGLTERQAAIAGALSEGASRQQAAQLLGVSFAVVKKELDAIYALLQVNSSAALARTIVEARALSWLTATTAGGAGFVEDQREPLGFALRPDDSRVAFSDYGPASGEPVLLLHSSMTTRIVSRKLLRALHQAGFRPIAIDRPGFGLTDPMPGDEAASDPFHAAALDAKLVLANLRIQRFHLASRGAAQFVIALARAMPEATGQVVIVNPGPPYRHGGRSIGPLASLKDAFLRNPANIRLAAPLLARQLTYRRLSQMMVQWTRGSPPDEAAVRDPELVADFFRSVRMFATGRYQGFLTEQTAIARMSRPAPFDGAAGWRLLLGASDVLYEPGVVLDYWRELLPGAAFTVVEDGGRFLAMTHPDLVVDALRGRAGAS